MAQLQLPVFPAGVTPINNRIGVACEAGKVVYVPGHQSVFQQGEDDLASFRLFTSQLVDQGTVRHGDVVRTFGVPLATVKRYVRLYRDQGPKGFFAPRPRRSASVLKDEMKTRVQMLLNTGKSVPEVGPRRRSGCTYPRMRERPTQVRNGRPAGNRPGSAEIYQEWSR